jgi:phosphoglycolate phosphatase (TIGR01487 family)
MYIVCLATDYDGTVAHDGVVEDATVEALLRLKRSGRKVILVTGRELPDLARVFPRLDLFDRVVVENGGLLFNPATRQERPLGPEPSPDFIDRLRKKGVPVSVGRAIVATWEPHESEVLDAIRDLGLELQITFNKGAVMVLPAGINKASGLKAALDDLGLSAHNVVAVGDAENDHAFMQASGFAVAVANALPAIKEEADLVTAGARGAGVTELIARIVEDDVDAFAPFKERSLLQAAVRSDGQPVFLRPHGGGALIAGLSGGGKSTLATALIEGMIAGGFQVCVFDPEGDYSSLRSAVAIGDAKAPPRLSKMLKGLDAPEKSLVVNMLAVSVEDRPSAFAAFVAALVEMRGRTGRPHWILVDEAHHVLPAERDVNGAAAPWPFPAIFVTVDPEAVSRAALERVDDVFAVGTKPAETIRAFCRALSIKAPRLPSSPPEHGRALIWRRSSGKAPEFLEPRAPIVKMERHTRKYAEGELGEDKSFYFRGPDNALNLRAQNLRIFLQMADGVDDRTWRWHLKGHDVSRWIREAIKDEDLAGEAERIEEGVRDPAESRRAMREAIERKYTAPAAVGEDLR